MKSEVVAFAQKAPAFYIAVLFSLEPLMKHFQCDADEVQTEGWSEEA